MLIISFFLNKSWTFKNSKSQKSQFVKYLIVSLIGLGLNIGIMFVNIMNLDYKIGIGIMVVVVALNNYILNKLWTF